MMKALRNYLIQLSRSRPFRRLLTPPAHTQFLPLTPYRRCVDEDGNQPPSDRGSIQGRAWSAGWAYHVGVRHIEKNKGCEDSIAVDQYRVPGADTGEALNVSLCDGISGGALGAVASASAANYLTGLRPEFPEELGIPNPVDPADARSRLEDDIRHVDDVVQKAIARHTARIGATTLSAAWLFPDGQGWLFRLGDCRIWHWHQEGDHDIEIEQCFEDQTYYTTGETPVPDIPLCNPCRMAGNGAVGDPEIMRIFIASGNGLLLTSDGVHNFLAPQELGAMIQTGVKKGQNLDDVANLMEAQARKNGSQDDVAALLVMRK